MGKSYCASPQSNHPSLSNQDVPDFLSSSFLNTIDNIEWLNFAKIIKEMLQKGSNLAKMDSVALYFTQNHHLDENNQLSGFAKDFFVDSISLFIFYN